MKNLFCILAVVLHYVSAAQPCNPAPAGDQVSYGTNNRWIGYVYNNPNFTQYYGYVRQGNAASPNFDQNFGGSTVSYATSNCAVTTTTFSVRYKLTKAFAFGAYEFTVGGDDGYRLSLDGGTTWFINNWNEQSYTTTTSSIILNGTYNLVLEYYENSGENRVSFAVAGPSCAGTENTTVYGTGNTWNGYIYDGTNFEVYKGMVQKGTVASLAFDEDFGGSNVTYNTSTCGVQTETFSARYRLRRNFVFGSYSFTVGGDDGYRLSFDGGSTWPIDNWGDHSYTTSLYTTNLNGTYDMVLEFYENGGDNRISIAMTPNFVLPVYLVSFTAQQKGVTAQLQWKVTENSNPAVFVVERSADGINYVAIGQTNAATNQYSYTYTDEMPPSGNVHYRLKITDLTGQVTYSGVASVRFDNKNGAVLIYPTIVTGQQLYLRAEKHMTGAQIRISDLGGHTIYQQTAGRLVPGQVYPIDLTGKTLTAGIYLVQVADNREKIITQKIVIP